MTIFILTAFMQVGPRNDLSALLMTFYYGTLIMDQIIIFFVADNEPTRLDYPHLDYLDVFFVESPFL